MGGGTGGCLGNWLCNLKQILMKCVKTAGAYKSDTELLGFFTVLNIAKYCVCYLWDHKWSPIHSPTFTVDVFSPVSFNSDHKPSSDNSPIHKQIPCEQFWRHCCRKSRTNCSNFPTLESIPAGEEGRPGVTQQGGCVLTSMLHSWEASGSVLIPMHPLAALVRISIPTNSFWVAGLFSWALGWGYHVLVSWRPWNCLRTFILVCISMGELLVNNLKHLCHHCRCFSEVNKGYLNYVYAKEFWLLQYVLQSYSILKSIKLYVVLKDKELLLEWLILYRDL